MKHLFLPKESHWNWKGGIENNPKYRSARLLKWKSENKDKVKESAKKYRVKMKLVNPDKKREYDRKWIKKDIAKKKRYFNNSIRSFKIKGSRGKFTMEQWEALKSKYSYMCLCCKRFEPDIKLTIDHVVPIIMGGSNNINNIQPLCINCNSAKNRNEADYRLIDN